MFQAAAAASTKAQRQDNTRCAEEIYQRENKCIFLAVRARESLQVNLLCKGQFHKSMLYRCSLFSHVEGSEKCKVCSLHSEMCLSHWEDKNY